MDIYQTVTDQVIKQMTESGADWVNPFNKGKTSLRPFNAVTQRNYRGVNILMLNFTPFQSNAWAGYQQWASKNCTVKKGAKGHMVTYFKMLKKEDSEGNVSVFPMIRYSTVFNSEQVEGDYARSFDNPSDDPVEVMDMESVEAWAKGTGADIRESPESRAFYSPAGDFVHMPIKSLFRGTEHSTATECYYSTLSHELVHWTGHASRLNRHKLASFGNSDYAFEELVAELGAAFLCAELGITNSPRVDHAQYLNNWLSVLKNDKRAIFKAASLARKASELLLGRESEELKEAA